MRGVFGTRPFVAHFERDPWRLLLDLPVNVAPWRRAERGRGRSYTHPVVAGFQRTVADFAYRSGIRRGGDHAATFDVDVRVIIFRQGRPADADNLLKGILDALNGVAYDDDRRVRRTTVDVRATGSDVEPRMIVDVRPYAPCISRITYNEEGEERCSTVPDGSASSWPSAT